MKKTILLAFALLFWVTQAGATTYYFVGTSADGVGSATMDVSVSGTTLTVVLNNTSPTTTDTGGDNIPAITAFGFDLGTASLSTMTSWSLAAYAIDNTTTVQIDDQTGGTGEWVIDPDGKLEGTSLDIIPNNGGASTNVAAALYNPAAASILASDGQTPHYLTEAILEITFSVVPEFIYNEGVTPYVRMQRVGDNTAGSLKLYGSEDGNGGGQEVPIPEPGTILLVGVGMVGLALLRRKQK